MGKTNIEWASHSWNPYTWNCNKVSPGCANCYATALSDRYDGKNSSGGQFSGAPAWRANAARELRTFKNGSVLFVNSMSDTYHEGAPVKFVHWIHNAAVARPDLAFLLLTKRPERAYYLSRFLAYPPNLWVGTSVENEDYLWRLNYLIRIPAAGRFVSAEPLLGSLARGLETYLTRGVSWVIAGAESGAARRPFNTDWAAEIRDMCQRTGAKFLFKQGSAFKPGQKRLLAGREWNEHPFELSKEAA